VFGAVVARLALLVHASAAALVAALLSGLLLTLLALLADLALLAT